MLRSFAFIKKDISPKLYYETWNEIQKWKYYFYKFAGTNAEEAMHLTLVHTLTHYDGVGNLSAYIKKLAREIAKENGKVVPVDFMEQTLADSDEDMEVSVRVNTGKAPSFENAVVNEMTVKYDKVDIQILALEFLDKFVLLCDSLRNHDTTTKYYPEIFINTCLELSDKYEDFNNLCLELFDEYQDDIEWFLGLDENIEDWKETDFSLIRNSISKRVLLMDEDTEEPCKDADTESIYLKGSLKGRKIYRINYYDVWDRLCDLVDAYETNECKFIIGDNYVLRTLGGSFSVLNTDLYNFYDLVRNEIVTNILYLTNSKLLNVGSRCVYILSTDTIEIPKKVIKGITIEFEIEDITESLV